MKNIFSNPWKLSFFLLVGVILIVCGIILFVIITFSRIEGTAFTVEKNELFESHFTISTNKKSLNNLIKERLIEDDAPYHLYLTNDDIIFQSNLNILGQIIPIEISLLPEIIVTGDLLLHMQSIKISGFQLPNEYVLQLLKEFISLPEWVSIYPIDHLVHIEMERIAKERGLLLRFKEFNLEKDIIRLEMRINM